jgi:hypothetical protein
VRDINPTNIPYPHREARQQTPLTAEDIIIPKASITMTNSNGDKRSPYLKPRQLRKTNKKNKTKPKNKKNKNIK